MTAPDPGPPRIEALRVKNFRALADVEFKQLTPLTVLLGSNGSGKSTVLDVFAFLAECFSTSLRRAWDRRGRARELRTRESHGPVEIRIKYRERPGQPLISYELAIDERKGGPVVASERLGWRRKPSGAPFHFLDYGLGKGAAVSGEQPEDRDQRVEIPLKSPDLLAVNALGQFQEYPRVAALREFIMGWHVSHLSAQSARSLPEAGPQEHLSTSGDNLANVIQYLSKQHRDRLDEVFSRLAHWIPRIDRAKTQVMPDGRLLLQIKDKPFSEPILAKFASDGTLKLLAYLVLLRDPAPPPFIGIGEPENSLHPRLLPRLTEECRSATDQAQLLVTTHSPYFLGEVRPDEVRILWKNSTGHTEARRACDVPGLAELVAEGGRLGDLWMEGHFNVGDPLAPDTTFRKSST